MKIGYARVSTKKQGESLDSQIKILKKFGCEKVFFEVISAISPKRTELTAVLNDLNPGDTLVVTSLDRLGRSLKSLLDIINELKKRSIIFYSIKENVDLSTKTGMLSFNMMASFAEFERELIQERMQEGVKRAHAAGKYKGRAFATDEKTRRHYVDLMHSGKYTIQYITTLARVSKRTLYDWKKQFEAKDAV